MEGKGLETSPRSPMNDTSVANRCNHQVNNVAYSGKSLDSNFELYPFPLTIPVYQHGRTWSHGFRLSSLPPHKKTHMAGCFIILCRHLGISTKQLYW